MITNYDAVRILEQHRGDAVVVTTMTASDPHVGWPQVTHNEALDFPLIGSMGKASSVALGLALARPDRKIMVLDGDGSLLMNLGTLVTISNKAPENLYHFVFENGVYGVTGGQPIPGSGVTSLRGMAENAGYAASYEFDDMEELDSNVGRILEEKGPILIRLTVEPAIDNTPKHLRQRVHRTMSMAAQELPAALERG